MNLDNPMQTDAFSFHLPQHLIAQFPPEKRGSSRLMVLDRSAENTLSGIQHKSVMDLPNLLPSDSLLVFNDAKVRKARLVAANAETGGRGEFLFLDPLPNGDWNCIVDKAKKKYIGQTWLFPGGVRGVITDTPAPDRRVIRLNPAPSEDWFEKQGHMPLPPYIRRPDSANDADRYQTVYARTPGSAAAPTAGLHFTQELLDTLAKKGIDFAWLSLQVGLGTFAPVRSAEIKAHRMHREQYYVPDETALAVNTAKAEGRPIVAVGTTSVRTLESAWTESGLSAGNGETGIFIYPGFKFRVVDSLITNFHTPKSTLLMLVCAFGGMERILESYRIAVKENYNYFSYGDAMLII